jgi:hypothetical protein
MEMRLALAGTLPAAFGCRALVLDRCQHTTELTNQ